MIQSNYAKVGRYTLIFNPDAIYSKECNIFNYSHPRLHIFTLPSANDITTSNMKNYLKKFVESHNEWTRIKIIFHVPKNYVHSKQEVKIVRNFISILKKEINFHEYDCINVIRCKGVTFYNDIDKYGPRITVSYENGSLITSGYHSTKIPYDAYLQKKWG